MAIPRADRDPIDALLQRWLPRVRRLRASFAALGRTNRLRLDPRSHTIEITLTRPMFASAAAALGGLLIGAVLIGQATVPAHHFSLTAALRAGPPRPDVLALDEPELVADGW